MTGVVTAWWCVPFFILTNLLFIGDIFGSVGRGMVARHLAEIVVTENIHLSIANGENASTGNTSPSRW